MYIQSLHSNTQQIMTDRNMVSSSYTDRGLEAGAHAGVIGAFVAGVACAPVTTAVFPAAPAMLGVGIGGLVGATVGEGVGTVAQAAANTEAAQRHAMSKGRPNIYKFGDMTKGLLANYQFGDVTRALLGCPREG